MAALPLPFALPLLTVAWRVPLPHDDGRPLTVTLTTVAPEKFGTMERPAVVQRGTVTLAPARLPDVVESDAAIAGSTNSRQRNSSNARRGMVLRVQTAGNGCPLTKIADYPLMTRFTPVTDAALTAGENVAAKLVPLAGVVPVASPSEAPAAPDSVILYGML
jgi:hypothetical protein